MRSESFPFQSFFTNPKSILFVSSVIYVDGSHSAPLRQYLYTMLEGSDPNQGRYCPSVSLYMLKYD